MDVLDGKFPTNKYIKAICKKFLYELDHQEKLDYFFDYETADKIINIMKLINFATGAVAGQSLYEACVGYQYFFVLNIFCWKRKDRPEKRRYEICLLWIARKNSKSVNASLIMIILMLLEPKYSEFYLCANTRDQAKIVYSETRKLIESSPFIKDKFDVKRDVITCKINQNTLKPLSSDHNTTDGLRVSAACIDEVGAAKDGGLIESMTSGMLSVQNRLLILISTSYPNTQNPFLEWTDYSKKVIDGVVIMGIGFDRYNCLSTAQKLESSGYETTEIKQHSSVLHSPTKLLEELVLTQMFGYENNRLLEINFANARCLYDTNLNRYVNKKKSTGEIDMVASLINAMYLLEKDMLQEDFVVQVF